MLRLQKESDNRFWKIRTGLSRIPHRELRVSNTMADDEIKQLRQDISKTGYVSEMIAARIFGAAGWQVFDHLYFLDKEEKKGARSICRPFTPARNAVPRNR
jgi:hypothetical protein